MKINNEVENDLIDKVVNVTTHDVVTDLSRVNTNDAQFQFSGDTAGISHQNLLSGRKIGIRHKEVPVLSPIMEQSIGVNSQTILTTSTGVVQAPKALKTSKMESVITAATAYNTGDNMTPRGGRTTGIDETTPYPSRGGISAVDSSSPTPRSGYIEKHW